MSQAWLRLATGRNIVIALALWLGFSTWLFIRGPYPQVRAAGGGADLLEERFGYTPQHARQWLEALGPEGWRQYYSLQMLDAVSAVLMAASLSLLLAYTLGQLLPGHALRGLAGLPLLAGLSEWAENAALLAALSSYPADSATLALASALTQVKLVVGLGALLAALLALVAWAVTRLFRRSSPA